MSSYKLVKSFCANMKGSFNLASLCVVLQQQDWIGGYSNRDLCLEREKQKYKRELLINLWECMISHYPNQKM